MITLKFFIVFLVLIVVEQGSQSALSGPEILSRQKRCIVIQKQSGTHGDSAEDGGDDDGDDYRKPQTKNPHQDKSRRHDGRDRVDHRPDVESFSFRPLKYKMAATKRVKATKYRGVIN